VQARNHKETLREIDELRTRLKETEQTLRTIRVREEQFPVTQELSLDAFTILIAARDPDDRILDFRLERVNPAARRILRRAARGFGWNQRRTRDRHSVLPSRIMKRI
jgi:hypothetical protein